MLIDLHVHSRFTPGCDLDPARVVEKCATLGLDGVCFTDLNTLEGAAEIHALRAGSRLAVLVGVKVPTDHGHYLCFFPDPENAPEPAQLFGAPPQKGWPAREVLEAVKARNGAMVAAYPYDREIDRPSGDFIFTMRGLSAVEGWNGRRKSNVNELAIEAADHLSLPCVGGSSAFGGYEELGTGATLVRDEVRDEAGLVKALQSGAVWAVAIGTPPRFLGDEISGTSAAVVVRGTARPARGGIVAAVAEVVAAGAAEGSTGRAGEVKTNMMLRLVLVLVLAAGCASQSLVPDDDRIQLERELPGRTFYLRESMYVGPFWKDGKKALLSDVVPGEIAYLASPTGGNLDPGAPTAIVPAGTRVRVVSLDMPTAFAVTTRMPLSPRYNPWLVLEVEGLPGQPVPTLVLRQDMRSASEVRDDVSRYLSHEDLTAVLKTFPEAVLRAVKEKRVIEGMPAEAVEMAWGLPETRTITNSPEGRREQWVWPSARRKATLVDGKLSLWLGDAPVLPAPAVESGG